MSEFVPSEHLHQAADLLNKAIDLLDAVRKDNPLLRQDERWQVARHTLGGATGMVRNTASVLVHREREQSGRNQPPPQERT